METDFSAFFRFQFLIWQLALNRYIYYAVGLSPLPDGSSQKNADQSSSLCATHMNLAVLANNNVHAHNRGNCLWKGFGETTMLIDYVAYGNLKLI